MEEIIRPAAYCEEEVRRQGHSIYNPDDGMPRVRWMLSAWEYALQLTKNGQAVPTVDDIETLGRLVELFKNEQGFRTCRVFVGQHEGAAFPLIRPLLSHLVTDWTKMDAFQMYRQFLDIHPFVDGNGRTAKVLLNWHRHSLLTPIFPPNDFWGTWIQNP
jgi:hypothetical protein